MDASALLTLALDPGPRADAIGALVGSRELHAPALLPFEVANVLRRRRLAGHLTRSDAADTETTLARLPVELWPHEVVAGRVRELGDVLTAYDASYVALAERLGADLLTCDRRIAGAPGVGCGVVVPD
ncbi:type II toxin-antitoxin system VapC family toxin [Litorihabitans aurantiacus]|uniref:Ribonuclease VapC n=1 Tax=Litorihabitans aurantiacus TaxID=1930061 RepID=A0AA37XGV4_9MICO|nr:type II toxin-antitoxin system VapC family toxin [Litorihabitans aurantiacus]GMA33181.1 VapC ribonuclease [Litorihabitans aurantiacus]